MAVTVTHNKTLVSPSTGTEDKVYGADYVAADSHNLNGLGTGVEAALEVNVGSAGAVVVNGGALGTPSSGTLTNATGLPVGGISATGTPDSTTFLRGDGTWNTPAGGSSAFNDLTSGTNTTAAMVVGTGATLGASGSGAITATAVPVGGVSGMGTGVGTFLATPSSANLASAVTDETGTGALVFATGPTITLRDASVTTTSGDIAYNATTEELNYSNGQRALTDEVGWTPIAYPCHYGQGNGVFSTSLALAAAGGTVVVPISVTGHMLFETLMVHSRDTATLRTAEWRLYRQRLNNGNSGENALDEVSGANGTFSFTPSAASNQSSSVGSPPIYLAPGIYWLAIRNTADPATFAIGVMVPNTAGPAPTFLQTKTLGSALGSTLDMVAATWTKSTTQVAGLVLRGRVFGETAVW